MKITLQLAVNQPAATVFDQIADARNEATWNSTLTDYKLVSEGPIGKGSTFTYKNRGNEFTSVLSEYNKPESLAFQVQGKPMDIIASVHFVATTPNSTQINATYELIPKGSMKLLLPILGHFFTSLLQKSLKTSRSSPSLKSKPRLP